MLRFAFPILLAACGRIGFSTAELSPTDGMSTDGTPTDGETQPLQSGCDTTHPGVLLCEGFEAPDVTWDYEVLDFGSAARTTERGAQGNASLKTAIENVDQFKAARWGKNGVLPNLGNGELHIREYLWLTSTTDVDDQLSILVAGNFLDPFPSANVLLTPGMIHAVVEGEDTAAAFEFPRDRWVCIEIHLGIDNTTGSFTIDIDGSPIVSAGPLDTTVQGGYTNVDAGFHYATPTQPAAKMFIDEIVADTAPIGCN